MAKFETEFLRRALSPQEGPRTSVVEEPSENLLLERLKKHQFYKAVLKCTSVNPVRRRVTNCRIGRDIKETISKPRIVVKSTAEECLEVLNSLRDQMHTLKDKDPRNCIARRESLRKNIDNMGDSIQWLKNKPVRSGQEEKHLKKALRREKLEEAFGAGDEIGNCTMAYEHLLNNAGQGDKFVTNETMGLHILDEYLLKNNEDLFQFLSSLDPSKTGQLDWETIALGLQKGNVPLETFQILQGIAVLQCDDGLSVNYNSFCEKMENFRKYKYRRLVSGRDEICKNLIDSIDDAKDYEITDHGVKRFKTKLKPRSSTTSDFKIPSDDSSEEKVSSPEPSPWRKVPAKYLEYPSPKPRCKPKIGKFWPGVMLDKIQPCYMPEDKWPPNRHHPLFEIVRPEKSIPRPPTRLPPFTRYTIYGDDKKL